MYGKFFGHFLRENKVITNSQLKRLLEMQKNEHIPFGVMAMDFGFLSASQVQEVVAQQQASEKRFGEIAVENGFLSQEQIERLARAQIEQHMLIGQLAVEQGLLELSSLESLLESFHTENTKLETEIQSALEASSDPPIFKGMLWTTQRLFSRVFRGTVKGVRMQTEVPAAGRLDLVLCLWLSCSSQRRFGQSILLRKPLVYSLVYCLLGRETSSERLIRESLQEFAWDLLKSEANSLSKQGAECQPLDAAIASAMPEDTADEVSIVLDGPTGPFPLTLFRVPEPAKNSSGA